MREGFYPLPQFHLRVLHFNALLILSLNLRESRSNFDVLHFEQIANKRLSKSVGVFHKLIIARLYESYILQCK